MRLFRCEASEARPSARPAPHYFPTLDGWRAVAITGVIICHAVSVIFGPAGIRPSPFLYRLTAFGSFGVNIFFGLSGFLICSRLLQEQARAGTISLKEFYARRFFRIIPAYAFYLAVIGLLTACGLLAVSKIEWLSVILFWRNYLPGTPNPGDGWYLGHFWSLAVEEHFYLLLPGLLILAGIKRARLTIIAAIVLVVVWREFDSHYHILERAFLAGVYPNGRTDYCLDSLLWGAAAAAGFPRWAARLGRRPTLILWTGLLILIACGLYFGLPLSRVWIPFLVPQVLLVTIALPRSCVARLLEWQPVRWVGRLSYSLYIWQQLFAVEDVVPRPLFFGRAQELPLNLFCILICAVVSYYCIEKPFINLGHRASRRRETAAPPEFTLIVEAPSA